jgi:D-alanyl-D-alanine carboxypeptidase/D-alanyl-D-alanine-endopeptidase (penicillin-binding protein 4)
VLCGVVPVTIATARPAQPLPVPVTRTDPELAAALDAAVALLPDDSCLSVRAGGADVYGHRRDDPQVPASTQKLLTASAVLDRIDPRTTLTTEVVTAAAVRDGIVEGDVVLVGGGDPVLVTDGYRTFVGIGDQRPTTRFDDLADQLASAGIREVRGRILVDESRYDQLRAVPSWPQRHIDQGQSGALSALVIDDGIIIDREGEPQRRRAEDPALAAGGALQLLLAARGVPAEGLPGAGTRPEGATVLASVASPPVAELVGDVLLRSDNHAAELLLKELGRVADGAGTTASGARAVAAWAAEAGAASSGTVVVDGSGLDLGNRTTCDDLVATLERAGPASELAADLPVAGRTGTLAGRYGDTAAAGVLRAKTGSLNDVSALAGFVELPEGATLTFALITNGGPVTAQVLDATSVIAQLLASWRPPCPAVEHRPVVVRGTVAAQVAVAAVGPDLLVAPGVVAALRTIADPAVAPLDRCARAAGTQVDLGIG